MLPMGSTPQTPPGLHDKKLKQNLSPLHPCCQLREPQQTTNANATVPTLLLTDNSTKMKVIAMPTPQKQSPKPLPPIHGLQKSQILCDQPSKFAICFLHPHDSMNKLAEIPRPNKSQTPQTVGKCLSLQATLGATYLHWIAFENLFFNE